MDKLRILICGDRNWSNYNSVFKTLQKIHLKTPVECVIEGEADGADTCGRLAAEALHIPVEKYPAYWNCEIYEQDTKKTCLQFGRKHSVVHGKPAGVIRNTRMLKEAYPTLVLAFHDDIEGRSKGTKNMVMQAKKNDIKTLVIKS